MNKWLERYAARHEKKPLAQGPFDGPKRAASEGEVGDWLEGADELERDQTWADIMEFLEEIHYEYPMRYNVLKLHLEWLRRKAHGKYAWGKP